MPSAKPHIILIDGESGAGKSTLADTMATALRATVVRVDDAYPGWGGLESGRDAIIEGVLEPLRRGETGGYRAWNWVVSGYGDRVTVPAADIVIIEGCGVSTARSRELADCVIWVTAAQEDRRSRRDIREGGSFREHWNEWDAAVDAHIDRDDPIRTATVIVNNSVG